MYYKIFKHKVKIENIEIDSFGIEVYEKDMLIYKQFDISTDYDAFKNLVDSLNENNMDIIHLDSILEDFYLDNV